MAGLNTNIKKKLEGFRMGSDPEIGVTSLDNFPIAGNKLIKTNCYNGAGFDHCGRVIEFRTATGTNHPLQHVQLMETIIKSILRRSAYFEKNLYKVLKIRSGLIIGQDSCGGHLHYQTHVKHTEYISVLDYYLAIPTLCIANPKTLAKRAEGYGKLSAARSSKGYGGFEYRPLPSWLVSKGFCKSILCLAYVVGAQIHIQENSKNLKRFDSLPAKSERYYYAGDRDFFLKYIPSIYSDISKMFLYPHFAREINSLFGFIKAFNGTKKKDWQEERSLVERWGITEEAMQGKHSLSFDSKNKLIKEVLKPLSRFKFDRKIRIEPSSRINRIQVFPSIFAKSPTSFDAEAKMTGWDIDLDKRNLKDCLGFELYIGYPFSKDRAIKNMIGDIEKILFNLFAVKVTKKSNSAVTVPPSFLCESQIAKQS